MPSPNPYSARMVFQWEYLEHLPPTDPPSILNVGCADDPLSFGELAHHYDLDEWSYKHTYFTQGNAEDMPFDNGEFQTVICGDVLEHAVDFEAVIRECCRVASQMVCFTIFEEWKLPGPGQWIEEGQANSDKMSQELGYEDREDYQTQVYPERVGVPDILVPHLIHINQFTDDDIKDFAQLIIDQGFEIIDCVKAWEIKHEDHDIWNWLIGAKRL